MQLLSGLDSEWEVSPWLFSYSHTLAFTVWAAEHMLFWNSQLCCLARDGLLQVGSLAGLLTGVLLHAACVEHLSLA